MKSPEEIVSMYMNALGTAKLSEHVWKRIAKVNQIILNEYERNN